MAPNVDTLAAHTDFLVGGTLKYLLSSAGTAMLYVRQDLIEQLTPTFSGWFAQRDIDAMDIYANDPAPTARRFESGTPPVANIYAALAGVGLIQATGLERIAEHIAQQVLERSATGQSKTCALLSIRHTRPARS